MPLSSKRQVSHFCWLLAIRLSRGSKLIIHTCEGDVTTCNENVEGQAEDEDDDDDADDLPKFGEYVHLRIYLSVYWWRCLVPLEDVSRVPLQARNLRVTASVILRSKYAPTIVK